jgi:hypothetical protein
MALGCSSVGSGEHTAALSWSGPGTKAVNCSERLALAGRLCWVAVT